MKSAQAAAEAMEKAENRGEPADERALWRSLRGGDRRAAEQLAEQTYGKIYGALMRLAGDPDLAADLTQETYRRAWSALGGFDGRSRFSTWLYRIAYNAFLNHLRRPRPLQPLTERLADELPDRERPPDESASRSVAAERTRRAVLGLPEDLRFAVTARYWGDVPVREIAEQQKVSTVAVRKRLKRAHRQLAVALEEVAP